MHTFSIPHCVLVVKPMRETDEILLVISTEPEASGEISVNGANEISRGVHPDRSIGARDDAKIEFFSGLTNELDMGDGNGVWWRRSDERPFCNNKFTARRRGPWTNEHCAA